MGKIKKILENELTGGNQSTEVYPVTSIKAVYDENNERLDNIIDRKDNEIQKELKAEVARATNAESNLRETIDNITEINENATSANVVTVDTIPNTSSSNVQQALNELFKNALFAGIATPTTNPGTPDGPVFYIATEAGIYSNFSGIEITEGEAVILQWNTGVWTKKETGFTVKEIANTKVFTNNFKINKVIRKLFIDTTGYTGSVSLDGLCMSVLARNVRGIWGIQLRNSQNERIFSPWMSSEKPIQSVVGAGIYLYAEYNWENMKDGQQLTGTYLLTNEAFNSANDPRGSINSEKLSDGAVTTNKIADKSVTEEKLSDDLELSSRIGDNSLDFMKMKLTPNLLSFNAGNVFNVLDYEGFNANPSVWKTSAGSSTAPIITIEEQENILGLKYARCFTIKDSLYNGKYYDAPYFTLQLNALTNVKTKSFCFFVNYKYLEGNKTYAIFSSWNGLSNAIRADIKWGTTTHIEKSTTIFDGATTSYLSVDINYLNFNEEKWAFVKGKFWVDDVSTIQDNIPTIAMGFAGGEGHVGEKTITCGWTFVAGDVELLPFQYYPYNKSFFELFTEQSITDGSITTDKIENNAVTQEKIGSDVNLSTTSLTNGLYGQAGDSISEGAGLQTLLGTEDIYNPISGTRKATYGYYIAKLNRMRWANYGKSGSTLGFVVANGNDKNGFSKENGRYTQMDDNLTHLSIFFGWNDSYYGPIMKKEDWLFDTYSTKIYFPSTTDLIGTIASDGTPYATQEQYGALKQVTGKVGSIDYDNSEEYFKALYVGTENDSTNKTFWGAWNIVLPYLINKYPLAKILLIVPFGCYPLLRQCVRDVAKKYGLATYDFSDINNQIFRQWDDNPARGMVNGKSISQFRIDTLTYDGLHPNKEGYEYMYPSINAKLMSL